MARWAIDCCPATAITCPNRNLWMSSAHRVKETNENVKCHVQWVGMGTPHVFDAGRGWVFEDRKKWKRKKYNFRYTWKYTRFEYLITAEIGADADKQTSFHSIVEIVALAHSRWHWKFPALSSCLLRTSAILCYDNCIYLCRRPQN